MRKAIKYSLIAVIAIAALLLCAGYYMLGYALKPEELVSRSRNIESSLEYMRQTYPEVGHWIDSLQAAEALHDLYIEMMKALLYMPFMYQQPIQPIIRQSLYTDIQTIPSE